MRSRATLGVLIIVLAAGAGWAQATWSEHTQAGEWAFSRGDYERAEAEFRQALETAQTLSAGDRRLETSLSNLALLYEHQMRLDEAQPLYELLLAAQQERVGERNPVLLRSLLALARVAIPTGDAPTAEASLRQYIEIAEESGAADPTENWRAMTMLARIYTLEERNDEALELQRHAIEVLADDGFTTEVERASELESLAQMELLHGEPAAAEELLDRAAELLPEDDVVGIAELYANAAATAIGAAEPEVAEGLALRSVETVAPDGEEPIAARKVLADVSWLKVRRSSDSLADLIGIEGDPAELAEAAARLEALLSAQQEALAANDPQILETISRLAQVSTMAGELDRAVRWQQESLAMLRENGAADGQLREAEEACVGLLTAAGHTAEAAETNAQLISQLEASWGADDPRLVPALSRQMELLTELGRKKEAKVIRKRLRKMGR